MPDPRRCFVITLCLSMLCRASSYSMWKEGLTSSEDTVFVPGSIPVDDTGQQMNVHEGWMLQIEDTFLWYGTNHKVNSSTSSGSWDWLSNAVNLYTSHDLSVWHKKSPVFTAAALPAALQKQLGAAGPYRIERPKVLYNSDRRYYVLIFHLDSVDCDLNQVGWAVSPSPYGPFSFEQATQPDDLGSVDITVAAVVDPDDEGSNSAAYLVRSVPDGGISISRLDSDYLGTSGVCTSIEPPPSTAAIAKQRTSTYSTIRTAGEGCKGTTAGAAPVVFSYQDHWYLLAADKGGWSSTEPVLYVTGGAELCNAQWTQLKRPATGPGAKTTFDSVPAFVLPYTFPGTSEVLLIYYGDRWNAQGPGGVGNASYVWLPLLPAGSSEGDLQLQLASPADGTWRIRDYRPGAAAVT